MKPQPARGLSRLALLPAVAVAVLEVLTGDGPHVVIGWSMLGLAVLVVALYAIIRKVGTDQDRADFPPPRQLMRQMRDDLRPVKQYVGESWRNLGGW